MNENTTPTAVMPPATQLAPFQTRGTRVKVATIGSQARMSDRPMSALGHKRTCAVPEPMSALPVPVVSFIRLASAAESDDPLRDVGFLQNNLMGCRRSIWAWSM